MNGSRLAYVKLTVGRLRGINIFPSDIAGFSDIGIGLFFPDISGFEISFRFPVNSLLLLRFQDFFPIFWDSTTSRSAVLRFMVQSMPLQKKEKRPFSFSYSLLRSHAIYNGRLPQ